jgi:hypothetical protein
VKKIRERQAGKRQRAVGNQKVDDLKFVVWYFRNWKLVMEIGLLKFAPKAPLFHFLKWQYATKAPKPAKLHKKIR